VLAIDDRRRYRVSTGIRFFDQMLELFTSQRRSAVDQHHTVEDVGIVLGQTFEKAQVSKHGILRAGYFVMPMNETLGLAAVDFFCARLYVCGH